ESMLSRPIDFGVFPDHGAAQFYDRRARSIPAMFRFTARDTVAWAWLMLKTWTAGRRAELAYARRNAAECWQRFLTPTAARTWRACFGPWIGSDWTRVSLHHAGRFFQKQLTSRPAHYHPADRDGPGWWHGAGDGWLLLRAPSSEAWFERWIPYLQSRGVQFRWLSPLAKLDFDGARITGATLADQGRVAADYYVLATNPFATARILRGTPDLERLPELRNFQPLVQDGPHTQVSFRLAFTEAIAFPRDRTAVVVADSEFNLTLFAEEQVWPADVPLGQGVRSLWTGTSCAGEVPGRLYGRPVIHCTEEEFIAEVVAQILSCGALDRLVREANGGRGLAEFRMARVEVWDEWRFSRSGIQPRQPKWVTTTHTQPHLPKQATPVPNLALAGAHTRTEADVWSIEGAVESGRRAARVFDRRVGVLPQYRPAWMRCLAVLDNACHAVGLPHILDLAAAVLLLLGVVALALGLRALWSP
ncbi:MAG TPA: FAD-dependent oxidoreductase, partial [Candidatus Didemnitutus sp.]|nr:FAD-dependent oxidoreductase [Candidatus Didemnitutus sp.]